MMQASHSSHYAEHIRTLQARTLEATQREGIDGLIIHSGQSKHQFLDDNHYPFKVNPQFKAWLPLIDNPNCWLIVDGVNKPKLIFYRPLDFWHWVPDEPTDFWVEHFDIVYLKQANAVEKHLPYDKAKYAYVGEYIEVARALGFDLVNPDRVLHYLHYHRAFKTDYELDCMRMANAQAAKGHIAAKQAFYDRQSEFDINQAYLNAVRQGDNDVPYNNIVALNAHNSILHYMRLDANAPIKHLSFLIDAGATYQGYAADITRTYAYEQNEFSDLIEQVDTLTLTCSQALKPGINYIDIHSLAYRGIGDILSDSGIVNMSGEAATESGIVSTFFPHGIGHLLGLQVHDVAGHVADDRGTPYPPPKRHPFLRCTRQIEPRQVFTIEPGLYFIESLLADLKGSELSKYVNWDVVDRLRPFGGIRVEDNVIVHKDRNESMTRDLLI